MTWITGQFVRKPGLYQTEDQCGAVLKLDYVGFEFPRCPTCGHPTVWRLVVG